MYKYKYLQINIKKVNSNGCEQTLHKIGNARKMLSFTSSKGNVNLRKSGCYIIPVKLVTM